ncbi:hypothetical protein KDK95_17640 [Actinospica sp. MGRD01-02]|uniref:Uncharacterized protein n=1 Tax=Actinospica acidithermotolerans TaxID=2828514 RepID=A0A941EFI9_9ACTN|nr:hypothetical protein [Actinospica acidithermotolerans]MBR7828144.1 hypothetical protein [Actinospica acidithermotolerans]
MQAQAGIGSVGRRWPRRAGRARRIARAQAVDQAALARKVEDAYLRWYEHYDAGADERAAFRFLLRAAEACMGALVVLSALSTLLPSEDAVLRGGLRVSLVGLLAALVRLCAMCLAKRLGPRRIHELALASHASEPGAPAPQEAMLVLVAFALRAQRVCAEGAITPCTAELLVLAQSLRSCAARVLADYATAELRGRIPRSLLSARRHRNEKLAAHLLAQAATVLTADSTADLTRACAPAQDMLRAWAHGELNTYAQTLPESRRRGIVARVGARVPALALIAVGLAITAITRRLTGAGLPFLELGTVLAASLPTPLDTIRFLIPDR